MAAKKTNKPVTEVTSIAPESIVPLFPDYEGSRENLTLYCYREHPDEQKEFLAKLNPFETDEPKIAHLFKWGIITLHLRQGIKPPKLMRQGSIRLSSEQPEDVTTKYNEEIRGTDQVVERLVVLHNLGMEQIKQNMRTHTQAVLELNERGVQGQRDFMLSMQEINERYSEREKEIFKLLSKRSEGPDLSKIIKAVTAGLVAVAPHALDVWEQKNNKGFWKTLAEKAFKPETVKKLLTGPIGQAAKEAILGSDEFSDPDEFDEIEESELDLVDDPPPADDNT